jgi:hypothetical protein
LRVSTGAPAQTQGRTIEQAQERIREALAALLDVEPEQLELTHDVRVPVAARKVLGAAKKASARAAGEAERAEQATRDAARTLVKCGMSLRDAGTLLGVSRQRAPDPRSQGRTQEGRSVIRHGR